MRKSTGGSVRVGLAVLCVLCAANAFVQWSVPAWFTLFGEAPDGLVSPAVDKWLITPLAMAIMVLQYPSYAVLSRSSTGGSATSVILMTSLFSMAMYAPLVLWLKRRATRRRTTGCS